MAGVALGPYVYAVGGQFQEDEFSGNSRLGPPLRPDKDTWTRVARRPTLASDTSRFDVYGQRPDLRGHRCRQEFNLDRHNLYVRSIRRHLDLTAANADPAQSPISVQIDGHIYVVGGQVDNVSITNSTDVLDLNESWYGLASMPIALGEVAGGVIDGTLYRRWRR